VLIKIYCNQGGGYFFRIKNWNQERRVSVVIFIYVKLSNFYGSSLEILKFKDTPAFDWKGHMDASIIEPDYSP